MVLMLVFSAPPLAFTAHRNPSVLVAWSPSTTSTNSTTRPSILHCHYASPRVLLALTHSWLRLTPRSACCALTNAYSVTIILHVGHVNQAQPDPIFRRRSAWLLALKDSIYRMIDSAVPRAPISASNAIRQSHAAFALTLTFTKESACPIAPTDTMRTPLECV